LLSAVVACGTVWGGCLGALRGGERAAFGEGCGCSWREAVFGEGRGCSRRGAAKAVSKL
jgi:hypothetical protein